MKRPSTSVVVLLVGVFLLVCGLFITSPVGFWPNYGQTPYYLDASAVDENGNESGVIEYDELPPVVQESFSPSGQSEPMYVGRDRDVLNLLNDIQYIKYDGDLYRVSLYHGDAAWIFITLLRYGLFAGGGLFAATGIGVSIYKKLASQRRATPE